MGPHPHPAHLCKGRCLVGRGECALSWLGQCVHEERAARALLHPCDVMVLLCCGVVRRASCSGVAPVEVMTGTQTRRVGPMVGWRCVPTEV